MKKEILDRIIELGGTYTKENSLQKCLEGIEFNHPLYSKELWGHELYGIDDFYEKNKGSYELNKDDFYLNLMSYFFSNKKTPHGQAFYEKRLFTPLTEGTADYDEWVDDFEDDGMTDLSEIKKIVGKGKLEFMQIVYSYGFPDGYYISLSDPNPENPTVFGTDHEVYFQEITNEGTLEDFLDQFYTKNDFLELVKNYINRKH